MWNASDIAIKELWITEETNNCIVYDYVLGLSSISFFLSFMETNDLRRPEENKTSCSIFMDTLQLCQACRFRGGGVAKGSMVGPVFFNVYLDFFVCIRRVDAYNFTDDSILSSFAKSVKMLLEIPITESKNAIKWFSDNKIIVNDDKFKSIIIQKSNSKKQ